MDRYIATELVMPFLFGVVAFSSIGVVIGALFDLLRKVTEDDLPLAIALQVFLLRLPYFISLAFPMSVLLSALMTYSRLSSDGETTALRSVGVSVFRIVLPAIVLSLLLTGISFIFNEAVVPATNYRAAVTLERALGKEKPAFRDRNILYREFSSIASTPTTSEQLLSRLFYAKQFDGERMKDVTILRFSPSGLDQIVAAESALWNATANVWDFFNGTSYQISPDGTYESISKFQQQPLEIPRTPLDLARRRRDTAEMTIAQIQDYISLIENGGDTKEIRKLNLRIQQKLALPFVCLVFGLAGATLGIRPQRTGRATSFGISLILILSYYVLAVMSEYLGLFEVLPATIAAWLPTTLGLVAGGALLMRASR